MTRLDGLPAPFEILSETSEKKTEPYALYIIKILALYFEGFVVEGSMILRKVAHAA